MGSTLIRFILTCAILMTAVSCSVYDGYQAAQPARVLETEARLIKAGFRRVPIDTPEQHGAVSELPLYRLNRYQSATGSVFWYVDPTISRCLYVGSEADYENYAGQLQQEHDTAAYANQVEPQQLAYLSPFGYAFPPPVVFGAWPTMIPQPIHSAGGGSSGGGSGGGVTPHPGGGGGLGSPHHGHSGGHSIGGHGGGGHH